LGAQRDGEQEEQAHAHRLLRFAAGWLLLVQYLDGSDRCVIQYGDEGQSKGALRRRDCSPLNVMDTAR
jgi:hypothetical protein